MWDAVTMSQLHRTDRRSVLAISMRRSTVEAAIRNRVSHVIALPLTQKRLLPHKSLAEISGKILSTQYSTARERSFVVRHYVHMEYPISVGR